MVVGCCRVIAVLGTKKDTGAWDGVYFRVAGVVDSCSGIDVIETLF
jgi:hypothetical protein